MKDKMVTDLDDFPKMSSRNELVLKIGFLDITTYLCTPTRYTHLESSFSYSPIFFCFGTAQTIQQASWTAKWEDLYHSIIFLIINYLPIPHTSPVAIS